MIVNLLIITASFIIGSLPVGALLARAAGVHDITKTGSGGSGATNVARKLGVSFFFLVLLCDGAKAFYVCLFVQRYYNDQFMILSTCLALLVGNSFSLFWSGRGGKGIATSAGILLAYCPLYLLVLIPIWLLSVFIFWSVGIASALAVMMLPLVGLVMTGMGTVWFISLIICFWCLWRHESHVKKLFT